MDSNDLIAQLAASAPPVRRFAPARQTLVWLGVAASYTVIVAVAMRPRDELLHALQEPSVMSAGVVGVLVAGASAFLALAQTVPGYDAWRRLRLAVLILSWLGWFAGDASFAAMRAPVDMQGWTCLPIMMAFAALPFAWLVLQLRRGAPLNPRRTLAFAALAAGALADVGAHVCHRDNGPAHLVFHVAAILMLVAAASGGAGRMLSWPRTVRRADDEGTR